MPNCSPNTLYIRRPSKDALGVCVSETGLGPFDPLDKSKIGPRRNREKVRSQIRDAILFELGAPVIEIELDEQQIDYAIDKMFRILEDYSGRENFDYYTFNTTPGQSVYEMPTDIGYVRNVYYKKFPNFAFQSTDLQGAIPIEYFYPGGAYASIQGGLIDPLQPIWGRMGEWHLYKSYEMTYSRISSSIGGWEYISDMRHIKLYPIPYRVDRVIVHYMQKNKDWNQTTQAMVEGAVAIAKIMLGRIWGKYTNPPGPNGGMQLNWQSVLEEGKEEYKQWKEDLLSKFGDAGPGISLD